VTGRRGDTKVPLLGEPVPHQREARGGFKRRQKAKGKRQKKRLGDWETGRLGDKITK
jgi:hypothetical protein